jgi:GNAT superfamily N-acetyltransferase
MSSNIKISPDPAHKKPRIDDADIALKNDQKIHANDFITLIFVDQRQKILSDSNGYEYYYSNPTYTHQLFEEERIDFLTEKTQKAFHDFARSGATDNAKPETAPAVLIYINCMDLAHYLTTRSVDVLTDREMLLAKIEPAIPVSSLSIIFAESISDSSRGCKSLNNVATTMPPGKLLAVSHSEAVAMKSTLLSSTLSPLSFEMFLASATDHGASELLSRAEKIAIWYIETADSIDFADERWEVLNLYSTRSETIDGKVMPGVHSFAGYMTLFTFCNPFLGSKIRVCQALVLPHMQGKGLGRKMLLAVYELAKSRSCITEVTVEDPAPAFERLRDAVDCEWVMLHLYEQLIQSRIGVKGSIEPMVSETGVKRTDVMTLRATISESFLNLSVELKERSKALKLTPSQTSFAYESLQYSVLLIPLIDTENSAHEVSRSDPKVECSVDKGRAEISKFLLTALSLMPEYKSFRLGVKRRLLSSNKYLKEQSSSVMQLELEKMFKEQIIRYTHCLPSIRRISYP